MGGHKQLSIIILSYNTERLTRETIDSIYQSTNIPPEQFEIIVLDNASRDKSPHMLKELAQAYANLRVIFSPENLGFSRGNNRAVRAAAGKYLLFLNSDIIVHHRAIDRLLEAFLSHEETVAFAGGKLMNADGTPQASCGPFYTLPVVLGALFLRGDHWGLTRSSPNKQKTVDWVSGACIMTTKASFEELGGFDEKIFMYMEEIDLLYRGRLHGMRTLFVHDARFTHLGSASSEGKTYPILQVYRGFLYFYEKHRPRWERIFLRGMLQLKALLAMGIGLIFRKKHIRNTYEEAYRIARMA